MNRKQFLKTLAIGAGAGLASVAAFPQKQSCLNTNPLDGSCRYLALHDENNNFCGYLKFKYSNEYHRG